MDPGNTNKGAKSGLDDENDMTFPIDDFWNFHDDDDDDVPSDDLELDEPLAFDRPGSNADVAPEKSTSSGNAESNSNGSNRTKRRRPSASLETADKAAPPPSWHSQAADKPHRREMICEIAVLLKARKKRPPSDEWLQQLPSKARRLEEGLYLKAQSLEAYLDRTTLKTRLKDLAESIMKDHQEWKRKRLVGPTPNASMSSAASRQAAANTGSRNSQTAPFGQQSSVGQANPMLQQMGRSTAGSQQSTMRQQNDSNASMAPSPYSGRSNSGMGSGTSGAPSSGSNNVISELEQQRAINERLQREIEENLRQQNMLLQSQGSGQMGGGMANGMQMPGNSNSTSNMMENNNVGIQGNNNVGIQGNNMSSNMPMMNNPPMNSNIMMQAALMNRLNTGQLSSNPQFALMQSMAMNGGNSSLGNPLMGVGNQNLLQQAQARFSNQQMTMLRNSVLPGNPMAMGGATSQMGSMNMPGQNGFNPTMPPPSAVQRNAMAGGPRGPNDLGDPSPLSPNSFNW